MKAINEIHEKYNYIACPHTAIAWLAAKEYQATKKDKSEVTVFLSTAHPCKFPDVFPVHLRDKIIDPKEVKELKLKKSLKVEMKNNFSELKEWLIRNN